MKTNYTFYVKTRVQELSEKLDNSFAYQKKINLKSCINFNSVGPVLQFYKRQLMLV